VCLSNRKVIYRIIGDHLQSDKGINLPDTELHLPALTAKDIEDLEFVVRHADIVNHMGHPRCLRGLAKKELPSRAEISDAAMGAH